MDSPVKMAGAVDGSDDGAGEVVFSIGIEAGHLCGFAADEGAAVSATGLGDATDDCFDDVVFKAASGEIIEEKERGGTLDGDVVDAVVDEVGTDGVVDAELEGDLELGADAVGGRDEHGVRELVEIECEEAAEAADLGKDVPVEGLAREHLDALLGAVSGRYVDACVGVGGTPVGGGWLSFWSGTRGAPGEKPQV